MYNESKKNFVFTGNVTSHVENDDTREQEIGFLSSLF